MIVEILFASITNNNFQEFFKDHQESEVSLTKVQLTKVQRVELEKQLVAIFEEAQTLDVSNPELWQKYLVFYNLPTLLIQKVEQFAKSVVEKNEANISFQTVIERVSDSLQKATYFKEDYKLDIEVKKLVDELINYQSLRFVRLPLINIKINNELKISPVTFYEFTEERKRINKDLWMHIENMYQNDKDYVFSYAELVLDGDSRLSLSNAIDITKKILNIIRAFSVPIAAEETTQFGIINEYSNFLPLPVAQEVINSSINEQKKPTITKINFFIRPYNLNELINNFPSDQSKLFLEFLNTVLENDKNPELIDKYLNGLNWLGESTKPDSNEARYTKMVFALESMIGGEPKKDVNFTYRGISAALSERASFIIGGNQDSKLATHLHIKKIYTRRSEIVHGKAKLISVVDLISDFGVIRALAHKLFPLLDDFQTLEKLDDWVIRKRYEDSK